MSLDAYLLRNELLVLDESTLGTHELAQRMTQFTVVHECATPELTVMQRREYLYVPTRLSGRLELSGYVRQEPNPAIKRAIEDALAPTMGWIQQDGKFWEVADYKMGTLAPDEGDGIWRYNGSAQRDGPYYYGDVLDAQTAITPPADAYAFMYIKSLASGATARIEYTVGATDYLYEADTAGLHYGLLETTVDAQIPSGTTGNINLVITPSTAANDIIWGWGIEKELG